MCYEHHYADSITHKCKCESTKTFMMDGWKLTTNKINVTTKWPTVCRAHKVKTALKAMHCFFTVHRGKMWVGFVVYFCTSFNKQRTKDHKTIFLTGLIRRNLKLNTKKRTSHKTSLKIALYSVVCANNKNSHWPRHRWPVQKSKDFESSLKLKFYHNLVSQHFMSVPRGS